MRAVYADDVIAFSGSLPPDPEKAEVYLDSVKAMVRAYTRGRGCAEEGYLVEESLAAVIVASAARLANNPTMNKQVTSGPFAVTPGTFAGWTLAELAVLNAYRKRSW